MSHRCINAFTFADRMFPGGTLVDDNDPILNTHAAFFARVNEPAAVARTEVASTDAPRVITPEPEPEPEPVKPKPGRPRARRK